MSIMISAISVSYLLQNLSPTVHRNSQGYPEIPFLKRIFQIGELSASFVTVSPPISHTHIGRVADDSGEQDQDRYRDARGGKIRNRQAHGININGIVSVTFAIGSLLALSAPSYTSPTDVGHPVLGNMPGLKCLLPRCRRNRQHPCAVPVVSSSYCGDAAGGLGYSTFSDAFTFLLLIVMLLVRPTGLFGEKTVEKV